MSRIAFISTMEGPPWGGSEELWSQTALRVMELGVYVAVNVKGTSALVKQLEQLRRAGCQITTRQSFALTERIIRRFAPSRVLKGRGVKWLDRVNPDCVVISQAYHTNGLEWMQACAQRNIPFVLVTQAAGEPWWPHDAMIQELRDGFEQARACFFVSEANIEFVRKQLITPLSKAIVVRNPFNVPYDVLISWPVDEALFRLACVARLDPQHKGQDILFQVLSSEKWRNRPIQVTLYGNGPNRQSLEELQYFYKLQNVVFGGFVADISSVWKHHHALILPSRMEGLPLAIVEAMLCARPCIVTDIAGNAELLEDNVTGFVAAAPTVALLDEAMERAWNRRDAWREMGLVAAERVRYLVPRDPVAVFANDLMELLQLPSQLSSAGDSV